MSNLDLIDWRLVGFSALWILGLSILLAAFSFADFESSRARVRTRDVLRRPAYQAAINTGLLLFCLGLLGSARAWWESLLWLILALAFAYQAWRAWPGAPAWTTRWRAQSRRRRGLIVVAVVVLVPALFLTAASLVLPDVLGLWSPRHYLVIAQNHDELRPTGGFITGVALVTISRGRPIAFELSDANLIDDYDHVAYPAPPGPLQRYMGSEMWLFRDANWSPDFPEAARQAIDLYKLGHAGGAPIDGVAAFDQTTLRALLAILGPIELPGLPEPITEVNFIDLMRGAWSAVPGSADAAGWLTGRKDFLGPLARVLLQRLQAVRSPSTALALWNAVRNSLDGRHTLLYLPWRPYSTWLSDRGWDGAVRPGPQDYLRVVDANLGFNKVNATLQQTLSYSVDLTDPALPLATLEVTYTNLSGPDLACKPWRSEDSTQYADYLYDCYWNYWRVLTPAGAQLISAPVNAVPADQLITGQSDFDPASVDLGPAATTEIAGLFVLPPSESATTSLTYLLPARVLETGTDRQAAYRLRVQKQPGTGALPLELTLTYPEQWTIGSATLPAAFAEPGLVHYTLALQTDLDIEIVFTTSP